jgi:hypothetical protein
VLEEEFTRHNFIDILILSNYFRLAGRVANNKACVPAQVFDGPRTDHSKKRLGVPSQNVIAYPYRLLDGYKPNQV